MFLKQSGYITVTAERRQFNAGVYCGILYLHILAQKNLTSELIWSTLQLTSIVMRKIYVILTMREMLMKQDAHIRFGDGDNSISQKNWCCTLKVYRVPFKNCL